MGTHLSAHPLPNETRGRRVHGGPRVPGSLFPAGPRPRALPSARLRALSAAAAPALRTCAPCLGRALAAFGAPGMCGRRLRASCRCVRRASGAREGGGASPRKGRACLRSSQVLRNPGRGRRDLSSLSWPLPRAPTGSPRAWESPRGRPGENASPAPGRVASHKASRFSLAAARAVLTLACPSFPGVRFCNVGAGLNPSALVGCGRSGQRAGG